MALALWLYWYFGKGKFSFREILSTSILVGYLTWLGYFALIVAPVIDAIWHEFFSRQDMLAFIFDLSSFIICFGSGWWVAWRLFREFEKQRSISPDLFANRWVLEKWSTYLRLFLQGGGLGLLCAFMASFGFALILDLVVTWSERIVQNLENILYLTLMLTMFASIPATLGGFMIANLFHLENLNGLLTRKSAFWQSALLAVWVSFGVCMVVGGLVFTNLHTTSVLFVTPQVLSITLLAGCLGGVAGLILFPHIQDAHT